MTDWMPCNYALALVAGGMGAAGMVGFLLGSWFEQLVLLKIFKPEI